MAPVITGPDWGIAKKRRKRSLGDNGKEREEADLPEQSKRREMTDRPANRVVRRQLSIES